MSVPLQEPPLSLYVHLPWCVRKCPYCDFNSHAAPALIPYAQYIDALLQDLDLDLEQMTARPLTSIFFGGGTPSLFTPDHIGRFLDGVRSRLGCVADMEVTLETNPGTIEHGRFTGYRDAGVTRVSLGAQTFSEPHLQLLGRIHGADEIRRAVDELASAGLTNFNLDLMYGLPQQTRQQALDDVAAAIALNPQHISHYQLTLEPGTVFFHRPPPLPEHDETWEMQLECQALLEAHGYAQYEISGYARPQRRCRHNLNYWQFGDYLGIGAGAHGKLTIAGEGRIVRTERVHHPRDYLSRSPESRMKNRRSIEPGDRAFEYMLNTLRLLEGFSIQHFEMRTGLPAAALAEVLESARRKNMLEQIDSDWWRPTTLGLQFLNELQGLFLPETGVPTDAG
ncbi:MAG: radical SAM family heme chaperone HemW [Steroidobacteraceae bacterium]